MPQFTVKPETAYYVWLGAWVLAGALLLWRKRSELRREPDGRTGWSAENSTIAAYAGLYLGGLLALGGLARGIAGELRTLAPGVEHFETALFIAGYPALLAGALLLLRKYLPEISPPRPHRVRPAGAFGFTPPGILLGFAGAMLVTYSSALLWNGLLLLAKRVGLGDFTAPQDLIRVIAEARDARVIIPFALGAIVLAPIQEELFYRSGVFAAMRARLPRFAAYLLSGLVFAAMHLNVFALLPLAILGAWLAWVYDTTADLRVTVTIHALFNLNAVVWAILAPHAMA